MKGKQEARGYTVIDNLDIRPINGRVLVRVDRSQYLTLGSGLVLGDIEHITEEYKLYMPADHAIRHGEVVAIPTEKRIKTTQAYTDIVIKVGDLVWFDYYSGMNAELLKYNDDWLYLINYEDLILRKNGEDVEMLNGKLLADTFEKDSISGLMAFKKVKVLDMAVITHDGKPVDYIHHANNEHIKTGDTVLTTPVVYNLENECHLLFDGKPHRVIERKNIFAQFFD